MVAWERVRSAEKERVPVDEVMEWGTWWRRCWGWEKGGFEGDRCRRKPAAAAAAADIHLASAVQGRPR